MKQIPFLLLPPHRRDPTRQIGKSEKASILKQKDALLPEIEKKLYGLERATPTLQSTFSSNEAATPSPKPARRATSTGVKKTILKQQTTEISQPGRNGLKRKEHE